MKQPFFSIIIPTLNEEKYLPSLLTDLSAQTFRDFEVVVVDGHSDDQTVTKALSYKPSLPLKVVNSQRRHVCVQRNLGAAKAQADWLIFMDADNRLPPYFLQGIKYRLEFTPADIATVFAAPEGPRRSDKTFVTAINIALEAANNLQLPIIQEALIIMSQKAWKQTGGFDDQVHFIEGRKLLENAFRHHLSYLVYHDPTYSSSFRRFSKFGKLKVVNSLIAHELSRMLGVKLSPTQIAKLYPMQGGTFFEEPNPKHHLFFDKLRRLLES